MSSNEFNDSNVHVERLLVDGAVIEAAYAYVKNLAIPVPRF